MSNPNPGAPVSEHKKPRSKKAFHKKPTKAVRDDPSFPVEVVVYDCVKHEKCIVEYRNENKWWFGTRLYKVYHPNFIEPVTAQQPVAYRWVTKLGKMLGPYDPDMPVPNQEEVSA
jgi:hypothetical protein